MNIAQPRGVHFGTRHANHQRIFVIVMPIDRASKNRRGRNIHRLRIRRYHGRHENLIVETCFLKRLRRLILHSIVANLL